jgi:hypothetical protein
MALVILKELVQSWGRQGGKEQVSEIVGKGRHKKKLPRILNQGLITKLNSMRR